MKFIKTYEEQSKGKEIVYTLKTKAKTYKLDHEYTVHVLQGDPEYDKNDELDYDGLVLSIDTTPGSWYVSTFLNPNNYSNTISISGDDWICSNRREIVKELKFWLENEYPIWKDANKYNL